MDPSPLIPPASSLGGSSREPVHLVYAPRQVFCGGDQTFMLVDVVVRWPTYRASFRYVHNDVCFVIYKEYCKSTNIDGLKC